jgi:hypothetical protein
MRFSKELAPVISGCLVAALLVASCGKSDEKAESKDRLSRIIKQATEESSLEGEIPDVRQMIENAGYVTQAYVEFPAQELGKKGRILVYTDKRRKSSGGLIYMKKTGAEVAPAWHWYFEDMVPELVEKTEINDDGLWDVRVSSKDGKTVEFVQAESFVLTAAGRSDWIALNGVSSQPVTAGDALWKCFDGDTSTAWRSSLSAGGEAFVEFAAPFGIDEEILVVQTMDSEQPQRCTLYADGKKVQEFELEPKAASQMIRLDQGATGAKKIRLVFDATYGDGDVVSVAELALR